MSISPLQSAVRAADVPPDRLAASANVSEPAKLQEACRQFEAVLLRQILSQGLKTTIPSALMPDSSASDIYQDMLVQHLADEISRANTFGLSQHFESQLARPPAASSGSAAAPAHD